MLRNIAVATIAALAVLAAGCSSSATSQYASALAASQYSACVRAAYQGQPYDWNGYNLTTSPIPVSYGAAQIQCQPVQNESAQRASQQQAQQRAATAEAQAQASASASAADWLNQHEAAACATLSGASWNRASGSCVVTYTAAGYEPQQYTVAFSSAGKIVPASWITDAYACTDNFSDTTWHADSMICSGPGM